MMSTQKSSLRKKMLALLVALFLNGCETREKPVQYRPVTWSQLSQFHYQPSIGPPSNFPTPKPQEAGPTRLPEEIRRLNGQLVQLSGYMMPIEMNGQRVLAFVLVRDQMLCCYGKTPSMIEWAFVQVAQPTGIEIAMDRPITVNGRLEVGEDIQEGAVISFYRMRADSVLPCAGKPKGWKAD